MRVPPLHASLGAPRKRARLEGEERGAFARREPIVRALTGADLDTSLLRRALEVRDPASGAWTAVHVVDVQLSARAPTATVVLPQPCPAPAPGSAAQPAAETATIDLNAAIRDSGASVRLVIEASSALEREAAAEVRYHMPPEEHAPEPSNNGALALPAELALESDGELPNMGWTRPRLGELFMRLTGVDINSRRITKERMLAMVRRALRGLDPDAVEPADIEDALASGTGGAAGGSGAAGGGIPGNPAPPPTRDGRYLVRNRDARAGNVSGPVEVLQLEGGAGDGHTWVPATALRGLPKKGTVIVRYEDGAGAALAGTQVEIAFSEERVAWPIGCVEGGRRPADAGDADGAKDAAVAAGDGTDGAAAVKAGAGAGGDDGTAAGAAAKEAADAPAEVGDADDGKHEG